VSRRCVRASGAPVGSSPALRRYDGGGVRKAGELRADQCLERPAGYAQHVTEVHHRQARLAAGVAPLAGHCVRLGAADAREAAASSTVNRSGMSTTSPHEIVIWITVS